jgi:UPF0716 protein FxsA
MTFIGLFFLTALFLSSAELFLLLKAASNFGFMTTFLLCLLTGAAGGAIVRAQGITTLHKIQENLAKGRAPAEEIVSGLILLMLGCFLLLPGFITDAGGLLLLIPPIRFTVVRALIRHFKGKIKNNQTHFQFHMAGTQTRDFTATEETHNPDIYTANAEISDVQEDETDTTTNPTIHL